ncbi:hypothetical protein M9458_000057, partial [Cirrhinus mrigala]
LAFPPGHLISFVSPPAYGLLARFTDYSLVSPPNRLRSPRIDPRLLHGQSSRLAFVIPVCYCSDPACLTMSLSRRLNKSLHVDLLASRLSLNVTVT